MTAPPVADGGLLRRRLLSCELNTAPTLSPDGRAVAFLRTVEAGPELWVRGAEGVERRLAAHPGESVADLRWTADGSVLLYRHTQRGREQWRLAGLRPGGDRLSVPSAGPVTDFWLSRSDPTRLVYSGREPGSRHAGLFEVDLAAAPGAQPRRVAANPGFHRWLVDGDLRPRGGTRLAEDGALHVVLGPDPESARTVLRIDAEGVVDFSVQGFSPDGTGLYLLTSQGAGTRRLLLVDAAGGAAGTVFEHPDLDVDSYPIAGDGVWFDPLTGRPDLCTVMDQRLRYHPLGPGVAAGVARLVASAEAPVLMARSADDRTWLVVDIHDDGPIGYRLVDPVTGSSRPLFVNRPELAGHRLAKLEDFVVAAGDRQLGGYAMRPLDREPPLPTVVLVHGGPADRDLFRFHAEAQYLASLGYLSLHVNYRGSKGFGIDFRRAGDGEWGGRMQDDLYAAVSSGVAVGLVDPDRVAFLGSSYGGYAALLAACRRPDLVRCAVAVSPPCDLVSFVRTPPPYWQPLAALLRRQVLQRPDGRELDDRELAARSPAHALTSSCAPLLVAHGVRDPRVPVAEVDSFVARARALGVPVRYLRFADEGHHVRAAANREVLFAAISDHLEVHCARR